MKFLERVIQGAEFRTSSSGLAQPMEWLVSALAGSRTYSGKKVSVRNALGLPAVYSAVSLISETIGSLPMKVYRDFGDGNRVEARQHRAWRMLHDMPNSATIAQRFWGTAAAHILLWGNVFIEKTRDENGLVDELWLLDPSQVVIEWDGRRKRFYQDRADGRKRWSDDQVLHVPGFSLDGVVGMSAIATCRQSLATAMSREEFEGGFYARGGTHSIALKHPRQIGEEGLKNLRESWAAVYGGSGNAHKPVILEEGMDAQTLTMPLADMEFVASQQLSRTDIAIIFKLPPAWVGGSSGDSLTYTTDEWSQIRLATYTLAPLTVPLARAISNDAAVFPQINTFDAEFDLQGLLRGDHKARAEYYASGIDKGWLKKSEARSLENLPPEPGIDDPPVPPPPLLPPPDAAVPAPAPDAAIGTTT